MKQTENMEIKPLYIVLYKTYTKHDLKTKNKMKLIIGKKKNSHVSNYNLLNLMIKTSVFDDYSVSTRIIIIVLAK